MLGLAALATVLCLDGLAALTTVLVFGRVGSPGLCAGVWMGWHPWPLCWCLVRLAALATVLVSSRVGSPGNCAGV